MCCELALSRTERLERRQSAWACKGELSCERRRRRAADVGSVESMDERRARPRSRDTARPARGQSKPSDDYETVRIPPLMSRKTLVILDGGRGGDVDRSCRRRGIKGKVK